MILNRKSLQMIIMQVMDENKEMHLVPKQVKADVAAQAAINISLSETQEEIIAGKV